MHATFRAGAAALILFTLTACAVKPMRSLNADTAASYHPVEVRVVVNRPQLYGAFDTLRLDTQTENPCLAGIETGKVPDVSWDCGPTTKMVAAKLTASRARKAEETIGPLQPKIADLDIAALLHEPIAEALRGMPNVKVSSVSLMRKPSAGALDEAYRASTAASVLFVYLDYHLTPDFSAFEVSASSLLYARSLAARTAAGLVNTATVPADALPTLMPRNAIYRSMVVYQAKLPEQKDDSMGGWAGTWSADNGRQVRIAVQDARAQLPRMLAQELQRPADAKRTVLRKVDENEGPGELIAESEGKRWVVLWDGSVWCKTTLGAAPAARAQSAAQ